MVGGGQATNWLAVCAPCLLLLCDPLDVLKSIVICEIFFQERAEVEERLPAPRTTSNVALPPLIHSELQVEMPFLSYSP